MNDFYASYLCCLNGSGHFLWSLHVRLCGFLSNPPPSFTQQKHAPQANWQLSVAVGLSRTEDSCLFLFGPAKNCRLARGATLPFVPRQLNQALSTVLERQSQTVDVLNI